MNPNPLILALVISVVGCSSNQGLLHSRAAEWQSELNTSVPEGASVQHAMEWGAKRGISFRYLEAQRQLYAIAERVPETGLRKFVCSEWSVVLKVSFSGGGLSEKNEVSTIGSCI